MTATSQDLAPSRLLGRLDHATAETPAGRSKDRHVRVAVAAGAGIASRALGALSLLIALPLAHDHLDRASLGIWTLLVTAVALLGFADLGLSNGLVNVLSTAIGADDRATARRAVTGTWYGLLVVAAVGAAVTAAVTIAVPWAHLLNVHGTAAGSVRPAVATFAVVVLITIPAGIGQRIHLAYQQGWAAALTNGAGSVLSILGVVVAAVSGASLAWFVTAMLGGNAIAFAIETIWVFVRSHPDLRPRRRELDLGVLRKVARTGGLFFILALAGAAAYQSDTLIISNRLGSAQVTRYVVGLRLFTLVPTALAAVFMPLWPAYGEALARRDLAWVRHTLRRSLVLTVAATTTASLAVFLVARPILDRWASGVAAPTTGLLVALAAWAVVSAISTTLAMYFNGANIIRFQVVVAILMASSNLALSLVLVRRIGLAGPLWASVVTQTLIVLVPELVIVRRVMHRDAPRPSARPAPVAT